MRRVWLMEVPAVFIPYHSAFLQQKVMPREPEHKSSEVILVKEFSLLRTYLQQHSSVDPDFLHTILVR
ncbi:hypothetical protein M404DRAFT_1005235 [Pisolithus tinctorius Marx 270]|uniref:Uncharacterized protein n=1 Tax=Pisolithus tinctorius Marx 270 TaxID=870435 RepID=A0A0C3INL2_PISTI|nr:hypothetical protein M404DRAFT_1005235 [Pisolithus tinctorius Marx 270]